MYQADSSVVTGFVCHRAKRLGSRGQLADVLQVRRSPAPTYSQDELAYETLDRACDDRCEG
jgi:hypothetical protein